MKHSSAKESSFFTGATSTGRALVAQLLIACILLQTLAPAALAAPPNATAAAPRAGLASRAGSALQGLAVGAGNLAAAALAYGAPRSPRRRTGASS